MGWQCHQLDHMQKKCTLLQTDIHITQLVNFYRPYALPVHLYCSAQVNSAFHPLWDGKMGISISANGGVTAQVNWLAAIWRAVCIHQINQVHSRNGSGAWAMMTTPKKLSRYYYYHN